MGHPARAMRASEELGLVYEVPTRDRCRWLKAILGTDDTEFAYLLNVSAETVRSWLKDPEDKNALESARFERLLTFMSLAKGVIRPDRLAHWVHAENRALGDLIPIQLLRSPAGFRLVSSVLEDLRTGAAA